MYLIWKTIYGLAHTINTALSFRLIRFTVWRAQFQLSIFQLVETPAVMFACGCEWWRCVRLWECVIVFGLRGSHWAVFFYRILMKLDWFRCDDRFYRIFLDSRRVVAKVNCSLSESYARIATVEIKVSFSPASPGPIHRHIDPIERHWPKFKWSPNQTNRFAIFFRCSSPCLFAVYRRFVVCVPLSIHGSRNLSPSQQKK